MQYKYRGGFKIGIATFSVKSELSVENELVIGSLLLFENFRELVYHANELFILKFPRKLGTVHVLQASLYLLFRIPT